MQKLLVKGDTCYADEFQCEYFGVFTQEEWDKITAAAKARFDEADGNEVELYFGTNECNTFESYEDWFNDFTISEISDELYTTLKKYFGKTFGTGDTFSIGDR